MAELIRKKNRYVEDPSRCRHILLRKSFCKPVVHVEDEKDLERRQSMQNKEKDEGKVHIEGRPLLETSIRSCLGRETMTEVVVLP